MTKAERHEEERGEADKEVRSVSPNVVECDDIDEGLLRDRDLEAHICPCKAAHPRTQDGQRCTPQDSRDLVRSTFDGTNKDAALRLRQTY